MKLKPESIPIMLMGDTYQPTIIKIGGYKGGIGKSQFAVIVADFFKSKEHLFTGIEFDTVNPDFRRRTKNLTTIKLGVFSDDPGRENSANILINEGMNVTVLANMPAQVFTQFRNWYIKNGIADLCEEIGIRFFNFHVSDGNKDSLQIISRSIEVFPQMSHVFVKNWGMRRTEWRDFETHDKVQELISSLNIPIIDFPRFHGVSTLQKIDKLDLSFSEALTHEAFDVIERSRVRQFLSKSFHALEQSGIF